MVRAQVMNVHQACLTTSEAVVKRRGAAMGIPVTAWSTRKAISFEAGHAHYEDTENIHDLAEGVLNNAHGIPRAQPLPRRTLELEVVEHSLDSLDRILAENDLVLLQLVKSAYMAACRQRDKRFGEAVVLAWAVLEQLLSLAWRQVLDEVNASSSEGRIPKVRRDKLTGRDYTASMIVESLELHGRIDHEMYRLLEIARKARNNWVHSLRAPKERDVYYCIRAVGTLFRQIKGIELHLQSGGRGGVPQWPVWIWDEVKGRGGP